MEVYQNRNVSWKGVYGGSVEIFESRGRVSRCEHVPGVQEKLLGPVIVFFPDKDVQIGHGTKGWITVYLRSQIRALKQYCVESVILECSEQLTQRGLAGQRRQGGHHVIVSKSLEDFLGQGYMCLKAETMIKPRGQSLPSDCVEAGGCPVAATVNF